MRPRGTPTAREKNTARMTTSISVRAPQITRERTSVDWTVVPKRCDPDGAACFGKSVPPEEESANPYGAINGAKIASRTKSRTIATPEYRIHFGTPRADLI